MSGSVSDCFKAYDVRARVPEQLNEDVAYRIGRAYAEVLRPREVAVGYDIRLTSPALATALRSGLCDAGVDVLDIGLCGTEQIYFATSHHGLDGGIMVTASHNPIEYNGMKFVRQGARPVSADSGLREMASRVEANAFSGPVARQGRVRRVDILPAFVEHLLGYVDPDSLSPLKIVADPGNGGAGLVIDALEKQLPFEWTKIRYEPDGSFPNGVPNPLLPENRSATIDAIRQSGADFGIAWDGDFDRCFFFDENGRFIEGYYIVGLLAAAFLKKRPGSTIIHDPRLTWNTIDVVAMNGGRAVQSKTGHAFIKERMRAEEAVYGGEMSGHHYFRDFAYCDSGMIPWLLVAELMSLTGQPLSTLVDQQMAAYPCSGEINFKVADVESSIKRLVDDYGGAALSMDDIDGVSFEFPDWRMNVRASNTEPVLRLNIESRADPALVEKKVAEVSARLAAAVGG